MNRLVYLVLSLVIVFSGCGDSNNGDNNGDSVTAKGGVKYGGTFKCNEVENLKSFYPLNITVAQDQRVTSQIYQGLVKLNQEDLSIMPCLAEKWEINEDASSFTFFLRKGIKFHDDPCFENGEGRELVASDVKFCLDKVCEISPMNQMFPFFRDRVVGAKEYYESTVNKEPLEGGVAGIKVIDDYTIQIDLNYSFSGFLNIISHASCWIYPKEAFDTYGSDMRVKCVGTGPFTLKTVKESETVILTRNPNYWEKDEFGNELPYLDGIRFYYIKEKKSELMEFKKGNLDMVFQLPLEHISDIVGELEDAKKGKNIPYEMQVVPAMSLYYLGIQHQLAPFNDVNVRKAFNYAIDKKSIVRYTLKGDGIPGVHGIVPPFKGYDYKAVKGYEYSPEKAKEHMKLAGFNNGKGFPEVVLQTNSGGGRNTQIAEVIQKMLMENLNINVRIESMQMAQHLERVETGKALFWRAAWLADYPDPENFLILLYGKNVPEDLQTKSYMNSVRYQSETYDSKFEEALTEIDDDKRYDLYKQVDQIAMNDAAMIPIFYQENTRLLQVKVRNFPSNAMEHRDMTRVYFDEED